MIDNIYTINPAQAKRAIAVCMKSKIPPVLVGPVGCGKTTAVEDFVKALNDAGANAVLEECILAQKDISNFSLPKEINGRIHEICAAWIPLAEDSTDDEPYTICFFDELDRCDQMVQNIILNIILGRKLANKKISDKCIFVGAMNGSSDMYTTPLSKAAINRVCLLYIKGDNESYDAWAANNGISPERRAFDKFNAHKILAEDEPFEDVSFATRRSLDFADKIMKVIKGGVNFETNDIKLPVLAGLVGVPAAVEYNAFLELYSKTQTPDVILKDPKQANVDYDPSVLFAVLTGLVDYSKDDLDLCEKTFQYGIRLSEEYKHAMTSMVIDKTPEACTCPTYLKLQRMGY